MPEPQHDKKTLVVGIGSTIRSDDGVGVHIVRLLKDNVSSANIDVVEIGTAGLGLLDNLDAYDRLIVVDAIVTGAPPGTIFELEGEDTGRTVHLGTGHEADLPTTLAVGREVLRKNMPEDVFVVAVEAEDITTFSERLTPRVEAAVPEIVEKIKRLL